MEWKKETRRGAVREGYRVLLRCEIEMTLPLEHGRICDYYRRVAEACLRWAEEVTGERRRAEYRLAEPREQERMQTAHHGLTIAPAWWNEELLAMVCNSFLTEAAGVKRQRLAAAWLLSEETILPPKQLMERLGLGAMPRELPFRPDGLYPVREGLLFYRNAEGGVEEWIRPLGVK